MKQSESSGSFEFLLNLTLLYSFSGVSYLKKLLSKTRNLQGFKNLTGLC